MQTDIIEFCKRKRAFSINATTKRVLTKAFVNSNAAKLPAGSFSELYAGKSGLLEEMRSPVNHIIWGRRGTGKTHLLNAFVENINDDSETPDIALYISCDRMEKETPREPITFLSDYDRIKFFANETYRNFIITLCEQLFEKYEDLLQFKKGTLNIECYCEDYIENIGIKILELLDICKKGIPRSYSISEESNLSHTAENHQELGISIETNTQTPGILGMITGLFKKSKNTNSKKVNQVEEKIRYEHYLPAIHKKMANLLEEMGISCLYVCIDELWLVDEKSSISFQPFFLDNIRLSLGTQPKLGVKIASIRETTNLNSKTDARLSYGMQSGSDITELAYLDPIQNKMSQAYDMFKEILARRINYFLSKEPFENPLANNGRDILEADYIVKMLFKDERNFKTLVDMSHGIPRNFINMLNSCLRKLEYNLTTYYIHYYLISEVVIESYKNEHRSDLSFSKDTTVFNAIDQYVQQNKQYFFLIDNKTVDRLKPEINTLLYKEIIHRIPSSETPLRIMNSYKAYYLDLGMYFLAIRDACYSEYEHIIQNFQLLFPYDLSSNYKHYVLNLRDISSDYIICPHCNNIFSKTHPVYSLYNICPDCALKIKDEETIK